MNHFDNYVNGLTLAKPFCFADKAKALQTRVNIMLNRLSSMFKWEGLPETIPQRMLELFLLNNGHCVVTRVREELYAFTGGYGGEPDEYYRPTIYTVANPFLNFYENLHIDVDCVLLGNDTCYMGLLPIMERYGTALIENDITMNLVSIMSRVPSLITADNDSDYEAAKKFIEDIIDGKPSAIGTKTFFEGVKAQPFIAKGETPLTGLIEYEQYLKAGFFNEIGLNANYNMKRESLNSAESQLNNDALTPLIDDMLKCRKLAAEKINEKYGTEITVDFDSAWKDNEIETAAEQDALTEDPSEETPGEAPGADQDESEVKEDEQTSEA